MFIAVLILDPFPSIHLTFQKGTDYVWTTLLVGPKFNTLSGIPTCLRNLAAVMFYEGLYMVSYSFSFTFLRKGSSV